jgi:5-methylcytosine-specific restriction endonuclease McrA
MRDYQIYRDREYRKARAEILATESVCYICGKPVDVTIKDKYNPLAPTVDHIIPLAKGGTNERENLALAHRQCNMAKKDNVNFVQRRKRRKTTIINEVE